jgi:hypothetical protein
MEILQSLLAGLREVCAGFTDPRRRMVDGNYPMADIGLAAFSLFFMQSESFFSDKRHLEQGDGTSNCASLFGIAKIPTDNPIGSASTRITLTQLTSFPSSGETALHLKMDRTERFTIALRIPAWAGRNTSIRINGKPAATAPQAET